jgi:hypothetical protein
MLTDSVELDAETWLRHRAVWPAGNVDTAPRNFWTHEGPAELRDPPGGFTYTHQLEEWSRLDDARRAWLSERGGYWRDIDGAA